MVAAPYCAQWKHPSGSVQPSCHGAESMKKVIKREKHHSWVKRGSREEEGISKRERYKKRNSKRHESCRSEASVWRDGIQEVGTSPGAASHGQGWEPLTLQRLVGPACEIISESEGKEKCWRKDSHRVYLVLKLPGKTYSWQWVAAAHGFLETAGSGWQKSWALGKPKAKLPQGPVEPVSLWGQEWARRGFCSVEEGFRAWLEYVSRWMMLEIQMWILTPDRQPSRKNHRQNTAVLTFLHCPAIGVHL